jgi:hypothetical protein
MDDFGTPMLVSAAFCGVASAVILTVAALQSGFDSEPQVTTELMTCGDTVHVLEDYKYASDQYAMFVRQENGDLVRVSQGEFEVDTWSGEERVVSMMSNDQRGYFEYAGKPCQTNMSLADAKTPSQTLFDKTIARLLPAG